MKRYLIAMLTVTCVAAIGAAVALAHTKTYKTNATINHPSPQVFSGKLSSAKLACEKNRTIRYSYHYDFLYAPESGTVKTDGSGKWSVTVERPPAPEAGSGFSIESPVKKLAQNAGHNHKCGKVEASGENL